MQERPQPIIDSIDSETIPHRTPADSHPHHHSNHGLHSIPPETLTSITSHLPPPALLALASTDRYLAYHIRQDSTWRAAFLCHFLALSPDSEVDLDHDSGHRAILLRRLAPSWRADFIARYILISRWARSKNLPVTHAPLMQSPIAAMHILPSSATAAPALLTASTQYGIVARSFPLSAKLLPGYLDASAVGARPALGPFGPAPNWPHHHFWNANPNAHFTPNITSCALSSSAASGHSPFPSVDIAWGSRAGEVLFTTALRPMDPASTSRRPNSVPGSALRVRRCAVGEEHEASVDDVRWVALVSSDNTVAAPSYALSAGSDGRVKLWDPAAAETGATRMCIWTSQVIFQKDRIGTVPDPCLRVEGLMRIDSNTATGCIVSVVKSGDIHIWTGFSFPADGSLAGQPNVREIVVPRHAIISNEAGGGGGAPSPIVKTLSIDPQSSTDIILLIAFEDEPVFHRIRIRTDQQPNEDQIQVTSFGDPNFGRTSVVAPFFARQGKKEPSFVLVGDHIGCVSLYAWDATPPPSSTRPILPLRSFEAHRDGASVTSLWWDGLLLITGSSRGTTHVWDGMTFDHLRSFVNPIKRVRGRDNQQAPNANGDAGREAVRHILVNEEKDVLIVGIGGVVLAWLAGPVSGRNRDKGHGVRGRHAPGSASGTPGKRKGGGTKYIGQFEMRQTILESKSILDYEAEKTRRAFGREREHRARLEHLGLSETEAVEYVLMLSREEAAAADRQRLDAMANADQGVFEGDFDDIEEHNNDADDDNEGEGPPSVYSSGSSSASVSSISRSSSSYTTTTRDMRPLASIQMQTRSHAPASTARPANATSKVQVVPSFSPPHRAEPMAAGEEYFDYEAEAEEANRLGLDRELQGGSRSELSFPPIPAVGASPPPALGIDSSPKSVKSDSAWSIPLTKRTSLSSASTSGPSSSSPSTSNLPWTNSSPIARARGVASSRTGSSFGPAAAAAAGDEMDDDLRFALELSLVEARSRGEDV